MANSTDGWADKSALAQDEGASFRYGGRVPGCLLRASFSDVPEASSDVAEGCAELPTRDEEDLTRGADVAETISVHRVACWDVRTRSEDLVTRSEDLVE